MIKTSSTKTVIGESYGHHDGAVCVLEHYGIGQARIVFAEHTERCTGIKHDSSRHPSGKPFIKLYGAKSAFYERPLVKNTRRFLSGEKWEKRPKHNHYINHHWSHAAASYYTKPWAPHIEPVCVVIDAIGEFDTASIWFRKKKVWSMKYPNSLGLFYSSVTQACGMQPNRDEHLTMALSAYGNKEPELIGDFAALVDTNLHRGFGENYIKSIRSIYTNGQIARAGQIILEEEIMKIMKIARKYSDHLCYGGGVALNCVTNTKVASMFTDTWIFPNPGDAGAALGAAAAVMDKQIWFEDLYLGREGQIKTEKYNPREIAQSIIDNEMAGLTIGKGEFGPRALGNRSLLGDPRKHQTKIKTFKDRKWYSPLAPAVLEEHFDEHFTGPKSKYMSYVNKVNHSTAQEFPSIIHLDNTARVQVVEEKCSSPLRAVLEEFYELTGVPFLINTSLNEKHKPMPQSNFRMEEKEKLEVIGEFKIY